MNYNKILYQMVLYAYFHKTKTLHKTKKLSVNETKENRRVKDNGGRTMSLLGIPSST